MNIGQNINPLKMKKTLALAIKAKSSTEKNITANIIVIIVKSTFKKRRNNGSFI